MTKQPTRILLIEDNPGDAELIEELLATSSLDNYELMQVDRLREAIKRLDEDEVDLILLDLALPDARGLDTLIQLYQESPDVPLLVLTGQNDEALGVAAVQSGAQDYLIKGQVTHQTLVRAIRFAIERHRLLRKLSMVDELTALYNRRGFFTLAELHWRSAHRMKRPFLLVYVDLDGLKQINDRFGHQAGSEAITKTAELLRLTFRTTDIIARVGGDEFVILAADVAPDAAEIIRARLQTNLAAANTQTGIGYQISLSLGMARFEPERSPTLEELLAQADQAMYEHKRQKKRVPA